MYFYWVISRVICFNIYLLQTTIVRMAHFKHALSVFVPSSQRGSDVLVDHRPISWSEIGGLAEVKAQIEQVNT